MTDKSLDLTQATVGDNDPLRLLDGVPLSDEEDAYVRAARASNTLRGYRSARREFSAWCGHNDSSPLPAAATITVT